MWNFKGTLWNSTQNILPIHWKIGFLYNIDILRALRFKSSYAFLKRPPGPWRVWVNPRVTKHTQHNTKQHNTTYQSMNCAHHAWDTFIRWPVIRSCTHLKLMHWCLQCSNGYEIWQFPHQQCCRWVYQVSQWYKHYYIEVRYIFFKSLDHNCFRTLR